MQAMGPRINSRSASRCCEVPTVNWTPGSGLTVLGTPIDYPGSTALLGDAWETACDSITEATALVTKELDPQSAHQVLRHCLDGCKVTHLPRSTDSYQVTDNVSRISDSIWEAMEDIV